MVNFYFIYKIKKLFMKRNTENCDKCGKDISKSNFRRHYESCGFRKFHLKLKDVRKIDENLYSCNYCEKTFSKMGIISHILRSHTNKELFNNCHVFSGETAWNKGESKESDVRIKNYSETYSKRLKNGEITPSFKDKHHTKETKELIGEKLSGNNHGGKCKWFDYIKTNGENVKLQGTWEVRFAKVLDIIDTEWMKVKTGDNKHQYIWIDNDNIQHYYTPDFYSPKLNKYFEVKGYWWGNDKNKMKQVMSQNKQIKIEIVMKNELINYEKLVL